MCYEVPFAAEDARTAQQKGASTPPFFRYEEWQVVRVGVKVQQPAMSQNPATRRHHLGTAGCPC